MTQSFTSDNNNANTQKDDSFSRNTLRQIFREKRSALTPREQASAAIDVLNQAIKHKVFANCMHVGIYLTNEGEINTQPIIDYLWEHGIHIYLPVLHPFCEGYLLFLQYTPDTKMKPNVYGIPEPFLDVTKLIPIAQLDLILAPLVAFDDSGNRMGMGGGFYDRTIAHVAGNSIANPLDKDFLVKKRVNNNREQADKKNLKLIGLAHDVQKTKSLPTQVWDIPLPAIITPTTLYSF